MMEPIRILIVDDHKLFREGLAALLNAAAETAVVGEAGTGQEAIDQAQTTTPDVILMDIQMPDMNGIEATRRILADQPHIGIIMLTMLEDDDSLFAAMRAGARGYILKGADKAQVLQSVTAVAEGQALFGAKIANRITTFFQRGGGETAVTPFPELTDRERELLTLIAQGHSNSDIAAGLHISSKTVSNHISNIFSKLQVTDRAQAIIKARDAGLDKH
ncbi:response regulator [Candidatus Leptofilum sp.]|uniref:response regulator n=1 Tax=Candidatus Leptofilum sp. TaxID=3241576 RepID=UPI003B5C340C